MKSSEITSANRSAIAPLGDPTNSSPRQRILVVDDDSDIRQISVDVLAGDGCYVEVATDGAAGWEALQNANYDLIITDNQMPRMTGIDNG